ncbi:phosphotransferase [Streptosporangium roseum]|uniref:phosphotransferase n=1 Tax=Streptosporangium roseum TaxID=2001 RepID=UPI0033266580
MASTKLLQARIRPDLPAPPHLTVAQDPATRPVAAGRPGRALPGRVTKITPVGAFAIRRGSPDYRACFLHRNFHPGNVLFAEDGDDLRISGIVDWIPHKNNSAVRRDCLRPCFDAWSPSV